MKSQILLAIFAVSFSFGSATNGWSNTMTLPSPPPTEVDRPIDSGTNPDTTNSNPSEAKPTFACEAKEELLLTVAKLEGQQEDIAIFDWDEEHFVDRTKAKEICENTASKLQSYYDSGKLNNISFAAGKVDDKPLLCIQELKEGQTLNGRSSKCLDTDEVLVNLDSAQKAGEVLCALIVNEEQKPQSCKIQHRGDFTMRFRFNWLPF
jgi:hypothetical protein